MRKQLYSTQTLAELLRVSVKTVHRERDEGKLNFIRVVGGKVYYRESDVFHYLDTLKSPAMRGAKVKQRACQGQ